MVAFLSIVHVIVAVFMILVVLLQAGKGGMGAAFGGASQTTFGGSGAPNLLQKITVLAAATFMVTSMTLAYLSSETDSLTDGLTPAPTAPAPEMNADPTGDAPKKEEAKADDAGNTLRVEQGEDGQPKVVVTDKDGKPVNVTIEKVGETPAGDQPAAPAEAPAPTPAPAEAPAPTPAP